MTDTTPGSEDYAEWIMREILLDRAIAQPDNIARALRLVVANIAQIPDMRVRGRLTAKILENPRLRDAIRNDETLWPAFRTVFESTRIVSGIVFSQRDYVDAVHLADRGLPSSVSARDGVTYELRQLCPLQFRTDGIGLFRENILSGFDGDWRRKVPYATDDALRSLLEANRHWLEASKAEATALYEEVRGATPLERTRILDRWVQGLAHLHLSSIHSMLSISLHAQDLLPMETRTLLRYAGIDNESDLTLEAIATRLMSRCDAYEVFDRLSGLPFRIPEFVVDACIGEAGSAESFIHVLLRAAGTPITRFHVLRVTCERLGGVAGRRLARRLIAAIIHDALTLETARFIEWVRWIADELLRSQDGSTWPSNCRSIVAWLYANQLSRLLASSGNGLQESLDKRRSLDCNDELLYGPPDALQDLLNPNNVNVEKLLLAGFADSLGTLRFPMDLANFLDRILRNTSETVPWKPALYVKEDSSRGWLGTRSLDALRQLFVERFPEESARAFDPAYSDTQLAQLTDDALLLLRAASIRQPSAQLLAWAQGEVRDSESVDRVLASLGDWQNWILTVARICVIAGTDEDVNACTLLVRRLVAAVAKNGSLDSEHVMTLVRVAGVLAHRNDVPDQRLATFAELLRMIAEASVSLTRRVGAIAHRLLHRLPGGWLSSDLTRVALLARFRGAAL